MEKKSNTGSVSHKKRKGRRGRPLHPSKRKYKLCRILLTEDDLDLVYRAASLRGLGMSAWGRERLLDHARRELGIVDEQSGDSVSAVRRRRRRPLSDDEVAERVEELRRSGLARL